MNLLSIFKKKEENKRSLVCVDWSGTGQLCSGVEKPLICVNVPNSFYTQSKIRKLLFGQLIKDQKTNPMLWQLNRISLQLNQNIFDEKYNQLICNGAAKVKMCVFQFEYSKQQCNVLSLSGTKMSTSGKNL